MEGVSWSRHGDRGEWSRKGVGCSRQGDGGGVEWAMRMQMSKSQVARKIVNLQLFTGKLAYSELLAGCIIVYFRIAL